MSDMPPLAPIPSEPRRDGKFTVSEVRGLKLVEWFDDEGIRYVEFGKTEAETLKRAKERDRIHLHRQQARREQRDGKHSEIQ